jgi:FAD/FMN-containing dehydrogenase
MARVSIATRGGTTATVEESTLQDLRSKLQGQLLQPGDPGYDDARTIWNAMIDRKPALIVRCAKAADVAAAVGFARAQGLLVSVRGGGHNIAGSAVCDGGLMIDLSPLRAVTVDPDARRAYVDPGATLADVDAATQERALATPLGINSTTGVAGLTLGGGFGWLSRKYGMTIDSLLAADVVTADGSTVRASADENADLFWAIRGGGGNFGVVTRFEFQLHPLGPEVLSGLVVFPHDQARDVLRKHAAFMDSAPDEMNVFVVLRQAPPLPFLPESVHGTNVAALGVCYAGEPAEGQSLVETIQGFGTPVGVHVGPQPYTMWQQAFDPLLAHGARNYWKSHNFTELSGDAIDAIVDRAATVPTFGCEVIVAAVGGAPTRLAPDATAYVHRRTKYIMNVHGRWETPDQDSKGIAWAREVFRAAAPFAAEGVFVNFMTEDETDRVGAAFGANYDRLRQIKRKYDPDNLFRHQQNIAPA